MQAYDFCAKSATNGALLSVESKSEQDALGEWLHHNNVWTSGYGWGSSWHWSNRSITFPGTFDYNIT